MSERPQFGTIGFYEAMADALKNDPEWHEKSAGLTCSMIYHYTGPLEKQFFVNFDNGNITEVSEVAAGEEKPSDYVISGPPDNWKAVLKKEVKPTTAMATGKLKVKGKQTYLLKNMKAFSHIVDVMTRLDPVYD